MSFYRTSLSQFGIIAKRKEERECPPRHPKEQAKKFLYLSQASLQTF
jgi:hypothetical protein